MPSELLRRGHGRRSGPSPGLVGVDSGPGVLDRPWTDRLSLQNFTQLGSVRSRNKNQGFWKRFGPTKPSSGGCGPVGNSEHWDSQVFWNYAKHREQKEHTGNLE